MTPKEYEKVKARIQLRYEDDIRALDRIYAMANDDELPHVREFDTVGSGEQTKHRRKRQSYAGLSPEEKKAKRSAYMKAWSARRKAEGKQDPDKGLSKKQFSKFLINEEDK